MSEYRELFWRPTSARLALFTLSHTGPDLSLDFFWICLGIRGRLTPRYAALTRLLLPAGRARGTGFRNTPVEQALDQRATLLDRVAAVDFTFHRLRRPPTMQADHRIPATRRRRGDITQKTRHPAVAVLRLSLSATCKVVYTLKTPYRDGTTQVAFEPVDFIARLAALVPKPRVNLTRYHGVLAPNHRWRGMVTPAKRGKDVKRISNDEVRSTVVFTMPILHP